MKSRYLSIACYAVVAASMFSSSVNAEVTSQRCPHSCSTLGIDKSQCRDWREGDTCYVDDLRSGRSHNSGRDSSSGARDIVMVNKRIRAGDDIEISLPHNQPIDRFDAVVRREGGSSETTLSASLGGSISMGTKQIDQNSNHVVQFSAQGARADRRDLILSASNGDIFVESVHVLAQ